MAAAVAGRSTAQKVGLAVGAGLAAGFGAYYITQVCNSDDFSQRQMQLSSLPAPDRSTAWEDPAACCLHKSTFSASKIHFGCQCTTEHVCHVLHFATALTRPGRCAFAMVTTSTPCVSGLMLVLLLFVCHCCCAVHCCVSFEPGKG